MLKQCDRLSSSTANTQYNITFRVTCETYICIYLITCLRCNAQYAGGTGQALNQRRNNHRFDNNNRKTDEKPVAAHFCQQNYTLNALPATVIDHLPAKPDLVLRKNRESRWIQTLGAENPRGLNLLLIDCDM